MFNEHLLKENSIIDVHAASYKNEFKAIAKAKRIKVKPTIVIVSKRIIMLNILNVQHFCFCLTFLLTLCKYTLQKKYKKGIYKQPVS